MASNNLRHVLLTVTITLSLLAVNSPAAAAGPRIVSDDAHRAATDGVSTRRLSPVLRKLGVAGVNISRSENGSVPFLQPLNDAGAIMATVRIVRAAGSDLVVMIETADSSRFRLAWIPSEGYAEITDITGSYRIDFDAAARAHQAGPAAEKVFDAHKAAIGIAMESISELKRNGVWEKFLSPRKPSVQPNNVSGCLEAECGSPPADGSGGDSGSGDTNGGLSGGYKCNGPTVRGESTFEGSRSYICEAAKTDANLQCWNSYCTGCCQFGACDAYCVLDDYLCVVAGITGTSCSAY